LLIPKKTYVIYCANRPGTFGRGDLFISFKNADGTWASQKISARKSMRNALNIVPSLPGRKVFLLYSKRRHLLGRHEIPERAPLGVIWYTVYGIRVNLKFQI
jgi:hypothetical protein